MYFAYVNRQAKKEAKSSANKQPSAAQKANDDDEDEYWDSEDEYDRNNWFYFANDVYEDAPFRLVDYQEK